MNMSSTPSAPSERRGVAERILPSWFWNYLGTGGPWTGEQLIGGQPWVVRNGIPRSLTLLSDDQQQTEQTFGFKWNKRDTFESEASLSGMRKWLFERYGDVARADWLAEHGEQPLMIDAGCGAAMSAQELFGEALHRLRYLGADVSEAIDVAADRFAERGLPGGFMQADITNLPFADASVDLIFSEGVLHHTDSTKVALGALARLL